MHIKRLTILLIMLVFITACNGQILKTATVPTQSPEQKIQETTGSASPFQTTNSLSQIKETPDPQKNPVIISQVTHNGDLETIYVKNISDQNQDITGFNLYLPDTTEVFNFPQTNLSAGQTIKVYNGPSAKDQKDGISWLSHPALVSKGDDILLLNRGSRLIWTYVYYP